MHIPCGDDSIYTRSQFADAELVAAADTAFVDAADTVVRTFAAGEADCDNDLDAAAAESALEILELLLV